MLFGITLQPSDVAGSRRHQQAAEISAAADRRSDRSAHEQQLLIGGQGPEIVVHQRFEAIGGSAPLWADLFHALVNLEEFIHVD